MKKLSVTGILFLLLSSYGFSQVSFDGGVEIDFSKIAQLQVENNDRINAAFAAMDAVQKAGAYIESLSDLFSNQKLTLPVGIKKGDYELIVQKITHEKQTGKPILHATCAFKFKDTGQKIAFEGQVAIKGKNGFGTSGQLALIAPVERKMGNQATLVVREGTAVKFGCEGVESFDAKMTWMLTSDKIIPTDNKGVPTNKSLAVAFDATFQNFDSYLISLNINQSFMIKGLNDIVFTLKGATLDQSDTETSLMTRFPAQYFTQQSDEEIKLWKGVAVAEASVSLPSVFKKPESTGNERITLSLTNVLFDGNGFTANAEVKDIIRSESLDKENWSISLNDFSLGLLKNQVVAFGFGGDINMPPFGKNSLFSYHATFNPVIEEYEFKVGLAGEYDFPALYSTLTLNELSTIELLLKEGDFYPTIRASGLITVDAPLSEKDTTKKVFSVPDISFENMVISRESPYLQIGAIGVSGDLYSPSIAGFEMSISDIHSFNNDKGGGLAFQAGISLNETFSGTAGMQLYGDYQRWKFREVAVDRIHVDYKSKPFSISGGVWFKNGDDVFGDGFRGDITLSLIDKFSFEAIGVFGKKDNYRYFLADAFFDASGGTGIPVPPVLSFNGFGGGLYRRMQQTTKLPGNVKESDLEFGRSLSGISYLPDRNVGLGVMATATFGLAKSKEAFNAEVGFEMQFNNSGGLNFVQLRGEASFMDTPEKWGKLSDNIVERVEKMEESGITQPQKGSKNDLSTPSNVNTGFLSASINIEYDVINKTFSADLNSFLNAGAIKGIGSNNRLGWASAYFSPDNWHVYMGTPSDRLGVEILRLARMDGYFMLGDNIPGLPAPPQKVLNNLSADKQAKLARSSSADMSMGKGIAFGSSFEVGFDATLPPFYARMGVGLGTEFMLTNLNGRTCSNYSDIPGINGWYAQVQAWAYVQADIGLEAKIFKKTRKFSILDISAATLLQGAGPNPLYLAGAVGGHFKVLGGLISGNCTFDFEIGEKCILSEGSPFGEDVISQLTPNENAKEVNVFTAPQVIFNIPVEKSMTISEEDVKGTYKTTLEEFTIKYKDSGATITGKSKMSDDGTVCMFTPDEPFESQKNMEVYAKVAFMKWLGGKWEYVKGDDGKPVFEDKKTAFITGDRPEEIMPEHVKYSYPIDRQYNFYIKEYDKGYILVSQNYEYLFTTEKPEGFNQVLRITDSNGTKHETTFTHKANATGNDIRLEIDFSLAQTALKKDEIYKLAIVNVPIEENASIKSNITTETSTLEDNADISVTRQQATETLAQLNEKEIYALHFRTSMYKTFAEKIKVFDKRTEGARDWVEPFVHRIITNLRETELFDVYEIRGMEEAQQNIQFTALLDQTDWYNNTFYKDMYQSLTQRIPAVDKIDIIAGTNDRLLADDEINTNNVSGFNTVGAFFYNIPYWCVRDFIATKEDIAKRALREQITSKEAGLLNTDFPPVVFRGEYPVKASYTLPGRKITTSNVDFIMYNPVTP